MDKPLIKNLSFAIEAGEKGAIIGENGVGKTTLLKLLEGELQPQKGSIKWAEKVRISTYDQDHEDDFKSDINLTDWMADYVRKSGYEGEDAETQNRGTLGRLLFGGDTVKKPVRVLSGGEKGRMIFGRMMLSRTNVMLMDEPTNHLDMESIESLNGALDRYDGTLMFVSHDRVFVGSLATRIFDVKGDGTIVDYRGTYEEYLSSQGLD